MWQLLVLSVFLITAHADIQNFYGNWTVVMQFPDILPITDCFKYLISKDNDVHCQCTDGKTTELLDFYFPDCLPGQNEPQHLPSFKIPVLEVTTAGEVMSSLGVSCTCGEEYHDNRLVARRINDDYSIMYRDHANKDYYSSAEPNEAFVQGRTVQTASEIQKIVNQVQDLSGRRGKIIIMQD